MFKIIKNKDWEALKNSIEDLQKRLEVLEFQRDYPNNLKLGIKRVYIDYNYTTVKYISCNEIRELVLPYGYEYKIEKDQIIAIGDKNKEVTRYKVNFLNNVLIEIPKNKD